MIASTRNCVPQAGRQPAGILPTRGPESSLPLPPRICLSYHLQCASNTTPLGRVPVAVSSTGVSGAHTAAQQRKGKGKDKQQRIAGPLQQQDWKRVFMEQSSKPELVEIMLRGQINNMLPWRQVTVRPLMLKQKPHLQVRLYFSYIVA